MPTPKRDATGTPYKIDPKSWGGQVQRARGLPFVASAPIRDRADQPLLTLLVVAKAGEDLPECPPASIRGRRLDLRLDPAQLAEKPRVLAFERFELLRPRRREPVERREEDALLEVEVSGESRTEALERMASVGASTPLERAGDFPTKHVEVAVLFRGLLREAFHAVSQADLDGRHAVRIPKARGACGRAGQHGTSGKGRRLRRPRGNGERVAPG